MAQGLKYLWNFLSDEIDFMIPQGGSRRDPGLLRDGTQRLAARSDVDDIGA